MARVYISSTYEDLKDCRDAVYRALRKLGHDVIAMEDYVARDERPLARCVADVRGCDVYVGLFAFRYGHVPADQLAASGDGECSITELEYREARNSNKECLCFLLDRKALWPPDFIDDDRTRINRLRAELEQEHTRATFKSAEDLATQVLAAVQDWERRTGRPPAAHAVPATLDVETYARRVRERYGRVELEALIPPERDEQLRIPLDAVYVEQNVREDRPPVELPKEVWQKLQAEGHLGEDELPRGMTIEDLARARQSFRERSAQPVFDLLAQPQAGRAVILGDPGAGKSSLTRYVLLSLLDPAGDPRVRAAYPDALPFLVELRTYAALRAERRCETFLDYFHHLGCTQGLHLTRDAVATHLASRAPTLVIFDGLDELFDPRERETITHQIAGFAADHPHARVLVTSRIVGYSPRILTDAGFAHYTLQDLERPQVERFLAAWFGRVLADRPEDAQVRRARILAALDESPSIRQLGGNPMLLTILAIIGKNQELPRERAELYQHAASVLVEHWDVRKHLQEARIDIGYIDRHEKLELLRRIAWAMQAAPGGLAGNYMDGERLREVIESHLRDNFQQPAADARVAANEIIRQLRERNFILARYGAELYGFVHRSFLEYFCATAILRRFEKTRELDITALQRDIYGTHWEQPEWHEVLRLLAGMLDPRFAGQVIDYLSREAYGPWPSYFGERPPRNLALAIECLGEVRNLAALGEVGARLLGTLLDLLEHGVGRVDFARNVMLKDEILAVVRIIGEKWPGREAWLQRLLERGPSLVWAPLSDCWYWILGALFASLPEAREHLLWAARFHKDNRVSQPAAMALAHAWRQHPPSAEELRQFARAKERPAVRGVALEVLVSSFRDQPETKPLLLNLVANDKDEYVRLGAMFQLASAFRDQPETKPLLLELAMNGRDEFVRRMAIRELASVFRDEPETKPLLLECMANSDSPVRKAALGALARAYGGDAMEVLLSQDLDGFSPFWDPLLPLSSEHIAKAQKTLRLDVAVFEQLLDKTSALLGWDVRKGRLGG